MSIIDEENEFDGDGKSEEPKLQWSPFKQYYHLDTIETRLDLNIIKSLIEDAFPDEGLEDEIEYKEQEAVVNVPCLASIIYNNKPCSQHDLTVSECTCGSLTKKESVCTWEALLQNFFRKKTIEANAVTWKRNFLSLFSIGKDPSETINEGGTRFKKSSVLDVLKLDWNEKLHNKPDPIYSGFGKLRNGFYVSSNGLVFTSEIELMKFNAKMAEMDEKLKYELCVIEDQHNKFKAKAEERKLLSQRTESHESDHDEEPKENQQLNTENKPKDKTERKSGLFASLSASLIAARSGIQGFWERSSPKEQRRSTHSVPTGDSDVEDDTEKLTRRPNSQNPEVDGLDNHDEFTRQMEAKGGLTYESADRTVQQLSHDALPPPLSLQSLQAGNQ